MTKSLARTLLFLLSIGSVCVACFDDNLVNNPSFDLWCGDHLCSWSTEQGRVERVATWHDRDYGVSFVATPTRLSQLSKAAPVDCMRFDMIADVDAAARLSLSLDFNDDGKVDFEQAVPSVRWKSVQFVVRTPGDYASVRFALEKRGQGKAVLAQLRVVSETEHCTGERLELRDGSRCTTDASCASGGCIEQECSACTASGAGGGTCGEGAGCHTDEQCAGGFCAGGECQQCAGVGACDALSPCDTAGQCASGSCVPQFSPSRVHEPVACLHCMVNGDCGKGGVCNDGACSWCTNEPLGSHCAACTSDTECGSGGFCLAGLCAGCRSSADCGEGTTCRYRDRFDAEQRECLAGEALRELPRGALCESADECAQGLGCGASRGEPRRCGIACELDAEVCGKDALCARPGLVEIDSLIIEAYHPLPAWTDDAGRVATCFPLVRATATDQRCSLQAQCELGACCEGQCTEQQRFVHGQCVPVRVDGESE